MTEENVMHLAMRSHDAPAQAAARGRTMSAGGLARRAWPVNIAYLIVLVLIAALIVVGSLISDRFATWRNLSTLLQQMGVLGIASLGQTVVVLTGGIDLAIGQLIGSTTVFIANFLEAEPDMVLTAVVIALLGSMLVGLLNGVVFVRLGVHPLIVTLGMSSLLLGCTLLYRKQPGGSVPRRSRTLPMVRSAACRSRRWRWWRCSSCAGHGCATPRPAARCISSAATRRRRG